MTNIENMQKWSKWST